MQGCSGIIVAEQNSKCMRELQVRAFVCCLYSVRTASCGLRCTFYSGSR